MDATVQRLASPAKITAASMKLLAVVALTVATAIALAQPAVPRFEGYPVESIHHSQITLPKFSKPDSGTELRCLGREFVGFHVNFAGHYVIDTCTCGSGCHYLYMWDALNGKVFLNIPAMPLDVGPFFDRGVGSPSIKYKGEQYRIDSNLLIIEGCIENTCDCATRYYRWDGNLFRLLKRVSKPRVC
jgi:hypothetical protein